MTGSVRIPPTITLSPTLTPMIAPSVRDGRIDGPRVYVRDLREHDAPAFVEAALASRALHGRWVQPPLTIADFLARMQHRGHTANSVSLIARRHEDDAVVGIFNLSEIIRGPLQQAYLGYYGFAPHARSGYMREGMSLTLAHAFRTLKLHRIEANIQPGNAPSIALARASGFVREGYSERYLKIAGRWRDHERWAIHFEAWRALRRRGT